MKTLRRIFFILFVFTALISIIMIHNLSERSNGAIFRRDFLERAAEPLVYIAVQLAGFIVVIFSRNRILTGIFSFLVGASTALSGGMAVSLSFGMSDRAGDLWKVLSTPLTMFFSSALAVCYVALGVFFFMAKPADYLSPAERMAKMKTLRRIFFVLFIFTALISANMTYNLPGYNVKQTKYFFLGLSLVCIAVQLTGLIIVVFSRNWNLIGGFSIIIGVDTLLSGCMAFNFSDINHARILTIVVPTISVVVSYLLFAGYTALGVSFLTEKPDKEKT